MRVLVSGGNHWLQRSLVNALGESAYRVRLLVDSAAAVTYEWPAPVQRHRAYCLNFSGEWLLVVSAPIYGVGDDPLSRLFDHDSLVAARRTPARR